jgi:hypothetical protein
MKELMVSYSHVYMSDPPVTQKSGMENNLRCQMYLPYINHFLAEKFASLSIGAFQSNCEQAAKCSAPSSKSIFKSPNGCVFGFNFVITRDEFANKEHVDKNHSGYTFGLFSLIHQDTGRLYQSGRTSKHGYTKGAQFVFPDDNFEINFDACDGVVEMVWASNIRHYSTHSRNFTHDHQPIEPEEAKITQFGSSCQIATSIVQCLNQIPDM